jgi:hypothetical protein
VEGGLQTAFEELHDLQEEVLTGYPQEVWALVDQRPLYVVKRVSPD